MYWTKENIPSTIANNKINAKFKYVSSIPVFGKFPLEFDELIGLLAFVELLVDTLLVDVLLLAVFNDVLFVALLSASLSEVLLLSFVLVSFLLKLN